QYAGGDEHAQFVRPAEPTPQKRDEQTHDERADDVYGHRAPREIRPDKAQRTKMDEMAGAGADCAADRNEDEVKHGEPSPRRKQYNGALPEPDSRRWWFHPAISPLPADPGLRPEYDACRHGAPGSAFSYRFPE